MAGDEPVHAGQLVEHADVGIQAQVGAALLCDQAGPGGDQRDLEAEAAQQGQALAVVHAEGFHFVAGGIEVQAPVGEGAVHVQAYQADAARAFADLRGGAG